MDKKLLLGIGAVATATVIGGAILFMGENATDDSDKVASEQPVETSAEDREKIENLNWDMWSDTEKYGFCFGEATIQTEHTEPILGQKGSVEHNSRELLLYDKEAEKLFVMTRAIQYVYEGTIKSVMGDMPVDIPVSEKGSLSEVYVKKDMPIRLDYSNNYVATDPTTKTTMWVRSSLDEDELVTPHIGCAGMYPLDNGPGKDLLVGNEQVILDKVCNERGVTGGYEGDFSFTCSAVDYRTAKDLYATAKAEEELTAGDEFDEALFNGKYFEEDSLQDAVQDSNQEGGTSPEDIQKALDEMKGEMDASQRAEE